MKKFINILSLITVAALAVVSCVKEKAAHEPGPAEAEGCYGVYFPTQEASGSHIYNPTQDPSVEITVARTNTKGAITVPVKTTFSEDGIFTMNDITFADGQDETSFTLRFDKAQDGVTYDASFVIEDNNYASLYNDGAIALDFSVMRVEMKYFNNGKEEKTKVHWIQNWWGEEVDGYIKYYELDNIRYCFTETIPETHFYKEYYTGYGFLGTGADAASGVEWNFKWYLKETNDDGYQLIEIPYQYSGYTPSDGNEVWVYDNPNWNWRDYMADYPWLTLAKQSSSNPSYYDGNGLFCFNTGAYIKPATGGGWYGQDNDCMGYAEGFIRVDYKIYTLESDYTVDGETPVYLETGVDVASVKYAVYEGELTATQVGNKVAGIADGTEESTTLSDLELDEENAVKYAILGLTMDKTATYTLVVVTLDDKGNVQESESIVFKHIAAGDSEEYAVDIEVGTEETPARYKDYDAISSFGYYVLGKDITEAHVGVVKTATYEKNAVAYDEAVKTTASLALSADALAQVNAEGGYFTLESGLDPLTTYTVIVWATNGDLDKIVTAEWTTDGLPMEPVATGEYAYKVAFSSWGTDKGVSLVFNPNNDTYVIQNIFYYTDFVFTMDDKGIIHFDAQDTKATYQGNPIYVLESHDYFTDAVIENPDNEIGEEEAADIRKNSYYDAENEVYNFNMAFVVPGLGSFGHGWETFTVTEEASADAPAPSFVRPASLPSIGKQLNGMWKAPAVRTSFERDPQPVQAQVKVSYERKVRPETGKDYRVAIEK